MKRINFSRIVFLLTVFLWSGVSAGDFAVDTDRLKTNPFYDGYFSVYGGAGLDAGLLGINFIMKYQPEPLATFDAQGDVLRSVVTNQFMADLSIAYSPVKWLDIGFVLPLIMYQNGDGWEEGDSIPSGGIGDMRLVPRFQLVNAGKGLFALSVITEITAPTGKLVHETMGASQFSFKPAIALGSESKWVGFAANFFYQILEKQRYAGSVFDDEFGAKAALSVHAVPGLFDITGEFISSTSISDPFDNKAVDNIELGGGFRVRTPVSLDIVAG
ncbi:MAG TPA: transporter, partial [bacterium]|nr:transporter [bacterium]